ncbi:MAG: mevalonate kinase [Anaerolineaceae bacterium]|nr:mevalonate kinase [Anaerolineaceae bacterium]
MPSISASAPGKIILFGEHAVVYGRPAIAVPVEGVRAKAMILARPTAPSNNVLIEAPDIGLKSLLNDLPKNHAFSLLFSAVKSYLNLEHFPAFHLRATSSIPIAAGLGSGAAIAVAMLRATAEFLGCPLTDEETSLLAFESEKAYHGTPSGIDNTVIAYAKPVWFVRGQPVQFIPIASPFTLVIANSGIKSSTAEIVSVVRQNHEKDPAAYDSLFDHTARISRQALHALQFGAINDLGPLMLENHQVLQHMGVSLPELDRLINAAMVAGALGAKLSGAGHGGNVIALVDPEHAQAVAETLLSNGAIETITTRISANEELPCSPS